MSRCVPHTRSEPAVLHDPADHAVGEVPDLAVRVAFSGFDVGVVVAGGDDRSDIGARVRVGGGQHEIECLADEDPTRAADPYMRGMSLFALGEFPVPVGQVDLFVDRE